MENALTFADNEIGHDERHGVTAVDIIPTIDVLAVDTKSKTTQNFEQVCHD